MFTTFSAIALGLVFLLCLWTSITWLADAFARRRTVQRLSGALRRIRPRPEVLALILLALGVLGRLLQMIFFRQDVLPEEMYTFFEARSLWQSGQSLEGLRWPTILPGWGGEGEGPLLAWLVMIPQALLGYSALAVRLPMLLLQVLSLCALWDMLRRNVSKRAALWALLLCACSPWQLLQSRWSLAWQVFPHLLLLAVWTFDKARQRGPWALLGMVLLALAMYTCDTAWCVVPLFALFAMIYLGVRKQVQVRWLSSSLLLFVLLALPAMTTWAVQTFGLPQQTLLGMTIPRLEDYPHTQDLLMQQAKVLSYGPDGLPAQEAYGLQFLPFLRDDTHFASLYSELMQTAYQVAKASLFQFTDDPGYTIASFLPAWGYLYLFSIPLSLLGILLYLVRRGKQKKGTPGSPLFVLLLGWVLCALPFLLTHRDLELSHYALLFYPLALVTAYGLTYVSGRIRLSAGVLIALYLISFVSFTVTENDRTATFPGLTEAIAYTGQQEAEQVVVTTRLYPQVNPGQAAAQEVAWVYQLEPDYIRGEVEMPGALPYAQRFIYAHIPSTPLEAREGLYYILHESEAYTIDADPFDFTFFGEYAVLSPKASTPQ